MVVSILPLLAFLIILILLVIPQLVTTISMLVKNFPGYWKGIQNWATDFAKENTVFGPKLLDILTGVYDKLMNWLRNDLLPNANLLGTVAGGIFNAVGLLVNFFIGLIISIYLMCDKENFLMRTKKVMASVFSKKCTRGRFPFSRKHTRFSADSSPERFWIPSWSVSWFLCSWKSRTSFILMCSVGVALINRLCYTKEKKS